MKVMTEDLDILETALRNVAVNIDPHEHYKLQEVMLNLADEIKYLRKAKVRFAPAHISKGIENM